MKLLEKVLDYSERLYEAQLLGQKFGNISLTMHEVSDVIKRLKAEFEDIFDNLEDDDDKARARMKELSENIRKAKALHQEILDREEHLFLKGEAEVFTVKRLIEQKPSNKSLIYKMDVQVGSSPFSMTVDIFNPHGKNKDTGEEYDYLKLNLPFQRSWKEKYEQDGETKEKTVYDYNGMKLSRTGDEWYVDINRTWENVKGALLSGFMKQVGIYDREYKRIVKEKQEKMKTKDYRKSCDNCRWHTQEEISDHTNSGMTESHWRHTCTLTGETVDDVVEQFYKQDKKEDKGPLQDGKDIVVNKNSFEEADYRPHTQNKKYLKENALYDFGADCPYHLFSTNFGGSIDDWYNENTLKGILPSAREVFEDDEAPLEFMLPDNIIVDFDDVEYVEWEEYEELTADDDESEGDEDKTKAEDDTEDSKPIEIPVALKENREVFANDEIARKVALAHCKNVGMDEERSELFAEKYVNLNK